MAKYLNKERFLQSMGLVGDETKYGNRDAEHSNRSYSTWMGYEIMGSVDDSEVEEDVVEVVRCKDCKYFVFDCGVHYCDFHTTNAADCGEGYCDGSCYVNSTDYCSYGERREGE